MTTANNDETSLPLQGLTVVELHAIGPVPFAGMLLKQLGAEVSRVSPPVDRGVGLPIDSQFDLLNAGKVNHTINLKSDDGMARFHGILNEADVLLEGFRPGVL